MSMYVVLGFYWLYSFKMRAPKQLLELSLPFFRYFVVISTLETIKKFNDLIASDRRLKVQDIVEIIDMPLHST